MGEHTRRWGKKCRGRGEKNTLGGKREGEWWVVTKNQLVVLVQKKKLLGGLDKMRSIKKGHGLGNFFRKGGLVGERENPVAKGGVDVVG